MEVGSSSSSSSRPRIVKQGDAASTSRGNSAIDLASAFHRSDSVPRLEDVIAGDSRLEELFNGDANVAEGDESESEDDSPSTSAPASAETSALCDRGHALEFLPVAPYPAGAFMCNRCSQRRMGEVYHCATCLFDLCPSCARSAAPTASVTPEIPASWGQPLLGCTTPAHALALLDVAPYETGAYMCNLCLKTGDAAVYHCTSCTDFDLHPDCARIAREIMSFTHPHRLLLQPPYSRGYNAICDGCLEVLGGSQWVYRCGNSGCDFDIHARCAKYARTISHPIHEEHELALINESTTTGPNSSLVCDACEAQVDPKELVYHCEECSFDIHPNCAIGEVVRS